MSFTSHFTIYKNSNAKFFATFDTWTHSTEIVEVSTSVVLTERQLINEHVVFLKISLQKNGLLKLLYFKLFWRTKQKIQKKTTWAFCAFLEMKA